MIYFMQPHEMRICRKLRADRCLMTAENSMPEKEAYCGTAAVIR